MVVGSDVVGFYNMMRIHTQEIDIYQFQINNFTLSQFPFFSFPYNPVMTIFWGGAYELTGGVLSQFPLINGYPYFQVSIFKLLNLALLVGTILSVLSYLLEKKYIDGSKVRRLFYISLFNPISFYIAILYIHLDTLPLYMITIGVLLLGQGSLTLMAAMFIALGISTKSQLLILLPFIFLIIVVKTIKNHQLIKERFLYSSKILLAFFVTFLLAYILPGRNGLPLKTMLDIFPQTERIWFTVLQYTPAVYLFITIGIVILVTMLYLFWFSQAALNTDITKSFFYIIASLVLCFSGSMLHTPATLMHTTVAFILIYAVSDNIQKLVYFALSNLVLLNYMLTPSGDIGKLTIGYTPLSPILEELFNHDPIRRESLLFTISVAAMFAFGILFYRKAVQELKLTK
jgi:hypothetical protein